MLLSFVHMLATLCVFLRLCTGISVVSVCLILKFLCVSDEVCVYMRFNVYFSQTDLWLSATVAPAKLLSPNTLRIHRICVGECGTETE